MNRQRSAHVVFYLYLIFKWQHKWKAKGNVKRSSSVILLCCVSQVFILLNTILLLISWLNEPIGVSFSSHELQCIPLVLGSHIFQVLSRKFQFGGTKSKMATPVTYLKKNQWLYLACVSLNQLHIFHQPRILCKKIWPSHRTVSRLLSSTERYSDKVSKSPCGPPGFTWNVSGAGTEPF